MRRRTALAVAALPWLAGCSAEATRVDGPDAPTFAAPLAQPPKLALVLAAGGPRGFAHVGVLRALHELSVQPDLVVGASIGALIGSAYAAGLPVERIAALAFEFDFWPMLRWSPFGGARLDGRRIASMLDDALGVSRFERLPLPFAAVGTDVASGRPVAFNRGLIGPAVQASCAIPGWFAPVFIGGRQVVDGDLSSPLPVQVARALGARRVLAVDVAVHMDKPRPDGAEKYLEGDRAKRAQIDAEARLADLVLHPYFGYWVTLSREFRERAAKAAYEQTLAQGTALRALAAGDGTAPIIRP
jgi:NTE family protein